MQDKELPITEHLAELRTRIIRALIALAVGVVVALVFMQPLFQYIMTQAQADGVELVQFTFGDAFLTQFKLAIIGGLVIASPFVLYQIIAFILPALLPHEKRLLYFGLPFATGMFVLGWAFGWFVVVPISKRFLLEMAGSVEIVNQITPSNYMSFVLGICNPLGIAFEMPLVVMILGRLGLVSHRFLVRVRKYAFLAIMVLAAVLSPPDVISMIIFLGPLYGLYELSILLVRFVEKKA